MWYFHIIDDPMSDTTSTDLYTAQWSQQGSSASCGTTPCSTGPSPAGVKATHGTPPDIWPHRRTHLPAAPPEHSTPLQTTGCRDGLTHLQPHQTSLHSSGQMASQATFTACSSTEPLCVSPQTDYLGTVMPVASHACQWVASYCMDPAWQHWQPNPTML
jgi:hypothetical protein